ncbi:MAG: hypothetical protein ACREU2_05180 [Steroidobacteraceae bacterium]
MIHFLAPGQGVLDWMQSLPISEWITDSNWGFPIMLVLHSWGMAAVVGILVMLDLRILGLVRIAPLSAFQPMMSIAWAGFFLNLISGVLMFMADANRLIANWSFLSKMTCVVLGGIVTAVLWRRLRAAGALAAGHSTVEQRVAVAGGGGVVAVSAGESLATAPLAVDRSVQVLAVLSIVLWSGAILFGRWIAYVMDNMILHGFGAPK